MRPRVTAPEVRLTETMQATAKAHPRWLDFKGMRALYMPDPDDQRHKWMAVSLWDEPRTGLEVAILEPA